MNSEPFSESEPQKRTLTEYFQIGVMMNPFLTGSRVYGKPNIDSDIDLVILMDEMEAFDLAARSDKPPSTEAAIHYCKEGILMLRFGELNLIVCTDERYYSAWKLATQKAYTKCDEIGMGLDRADSVRIFQDIFQQNGLS